MTKAKNKPRARILKVWTRDLDSGVTYAQAINRKYHYSHLHEIPSESLQALLDELTNLHGAPVAVEEVQGVTGKPITLYHYISNQGIRVKKSSWRK